MSSLDQLQQEALTRIGRNIIFYQRIEIVLKSLLPFMHPDGGKKGAESFSELKGVLSQKTLGMLFGEFNKSVVVRGTEPSESNPLEGYLRCVVNDRNELVHTMLKTQGMSLDTLDGCESIIRYLDEKLADIENVNALLEPICRNLLLTLHGAEYEDGKLKAEIKSTLELRIKFE